MKVLLASAMVLGCAVGTLSADGSVDNPVYEHLVQEGIPINDQAVKLPEPSLSAEADKEAQSEVVHGIAARKKYKYDDFVRKSPVAPFLLEINTAGEAGEGDRVQRIDLWFVAYGKLSDVTDEDLLGQLVGSGSENEKGESQSLSDKELKERDLQVESTDDRRESYYQVDSPLLDKVRISGIGHGVTTREATRVLAASLLDPRFLDDPKYPNRWRSIVREPSGKKTLGKQSPYAGFGGYSQVVQLVEPKGALFIECHMAINEPHGWFNGTNLLRSKLPVLMQDNVRTLRRKLAK